jgi:PAS domain-containing protein
VVSPADHDVPDEQLFENLPVMLVACDDQKRTLAWNHECERVDGIPGRIR